MLADTDSSSSCRTKLHPTISQTFSEELSDLLDDR